jgi:hypothetical protein
MTDEEAIKQFTTLRDMAAAWDRPEKEIYGHALVALADRQALVEASWSTSLPDGILLRIDAARRHMEGK